MSEEALVALGGAIGATINAFFNYLTQRSKGETEELNVSERVARQLLERVQTLETKVQEQHTELETLREDLRSARTMIAMLRRRRRTQTRFRPIPQRGQEGGQTH